MPRIFIGSDHRGFVAKQHILATLANSEWKDSYEIVDLGPETIRPDDDFNDYAIAVSRAVRETANSRGILICGSAHGIAIQANRFKGIRAICGYTPELVRLGRLHNDANVLCLSSDLWTMQILIRPSICSFAVIFCPKKDILGATNDLMRNQFINKGKLWVRMYI